jgi:uncharacterized Zn finger protein
MLTVPGALANSCPLLTRSPARARARSGEGSSITISEHSVEVTVRASGIPTFKRTKWSLNVTVQQVSASAWAAVIDRLSAIAAA